jgi:K+-sensing histidine kinase KdpD
LGIAGLALITPVCFHIGFGVTRTSFVYVILIALVSLLGSLGVSVVLSIVAVACLNYFFVPPLFGFHVRRDKAALFQWVQGPPGDRSSRKQPGQAWR